MTQNIKLGLCEGRHSIPEVNEYIFPADVNPLDVTGLQSAAVERLKAVFPEATVSVTNLPNQADYTDIPVYVRGKLDLYVTGLSVALIAALNACRELGISVTLYHYDRDGGQYYPQSVI